jgi:hypothetical protein
MAKKEAKKQEISSLAASTRSNQFNMRSFHCGFGKKCAARDALVSFPKPKWEFSQRQSEREGPFSSLSGEGGVCSLLGPWLFLKRCGTLLLHTDGCCGKHASYWRKGGSSQSLRGDGATGFSSLADVESKLRVIDVLRTRTCTSTPYS